MFVSINFAPLEISLYKIGLLMIA